MSVSKIFLNFHWDIAMCDTFNVWYIFWKASKLTNCKDSSRIQKPLHGFHSLTLNFNFELIDFWLCWRNIVFIVSDKFTRPIKLFFSEAWRSQKGWKKRWSKRWSLHWKIRVLMVLTTGAQGKEGGVVRALASHQCGPGSNPGVDAVCGLSLLLVLSFAPRGFSPGTPVFPSSQKPTLQNCN